MEYYIINTDWRAREDLITCDLWFKYGMAFTGDFGGDDNKNHKYGELLAKLKKNDILLMYHSLNDTRKHFKKGVIGIGEVLEEWNSKIYKKSDRLLYKKETHEYRISVNWFIDWRKNPKNAKEDLKLFTSPKTLARIDKDKYQIKRLLSFLNINKAEENIVDEQVESIYEGRKKEITSLVFRRNPKARQGCLTRWGYKCFVCGFDFAEFYGKTGKNYIQVHHLKPLSNYEEGLKVNPVSDLRPLCPNCHAIVHRKNPPYSMDEMKKLVKYTFTDLLK